MGRIIRRSRGEDYSTVCGEVNGYSCECETAWVHMVHRLHGNTTVTVPLWKHTCDIQ